MTLKKQPRRKLVPVAVATLSLVALLVATPTAWTDDVDLLRQKGGKPFVFILIDTSTSMNLDPDNQWLPAGGDDPRSKMFQVKKAVYEVFSAVDNVHYGFAGFNQDRLRIKSKHWLYGANSAASWFSGSVEYPAQGEPWTFGAHFDLDGDGTGEAVAGTCAAPLDLDTERVRLNRFAKLGLTAVGPTELWIEQGGTTYRLTVARTSGLLGDTGETADLGLATMTVGLQLDRIADCSSLLTSGSESQRITFQRGTDFLHVERDVGLAGTAASTGGDAGECTGFDKVAGFWDFQDVAAADTCGTDLGGPFTGRGWEGNNDSGARTGDSDVDECCIDTRDGTGACVDLETTNVPARFLECYNARFPTVVHPSFPELDKGDMIPFNWEVEFKDEFLKRLNPRHPGGIDYRVATYFEDTPDPVTGNLQLRNEDRRPLVAFGNSPLGRAINDFRCWYRGGQDAKCKGPAFDPGWEELLFDNDLEFGCRIPWLIVISDGEDNATRENPAADTANLWAKAGIRSFVITFDDPERKLGAIARNGKGELFTVTNGAELKTQLEDIVGIIQEESRSFASAAVPSVQAAVEDKIFITNFTPLNSAGWWDGHAHSFLKPLPLDPDNGRPDFDHPNHLWDAGEEAMLDQAPSPGSGADNSGVDLQLGGGVNERRVYYSVEPVPGNNNFDAWTENRRLFDRTSDSMSNRQLIENDLWDDLLGSTCASTDTTCQTDNRQDANAIIENTLVEKTVTSADLGTLTFILGDIFHSDPLVVGSPANVTFFAQNLGAEVAPEKGYREFFRKHQNRRKVLFFGANDGMLHAINSGQADIVDGQVQFDNGTGHELFAYIPRAALPTVAGLSNDPTTHRWGVDGPPVVADVFLDVVHGGTPDPDDREWRTVLINGMREGGRAYFALDVTQPDEMEERTVDGETVILPEDSTGIVPSCRDSLGSTDLGCDDEVTYPATLWEFTDAVRDTATQELVELDEDDNGIADLGETWSAPNIGRIRVCEGSTCLPSGDPDNPDDVVTKFVAIFGGGMDPAKADVQGNWLYIVDIETGEALYKRQLEGSAPSGPAAVDTDGDGFLDRIYIGTTAGFMYRVDLVEFDSSGDLRPFPQLETETVNRVDDVDQDVLRIKETPAGGGDPVWQPQKIFDTAGRPIYFRPSVLFVAQLGRYAITFGTGEREDLAAKTLEQGRFYAFVDDSDLVDADDLPFTESNLTGITADQAPDANNTNLLTQSSVGSRGWFLILNEEERLISNPFGLSGVTFFTTFESDVVNEGGEVGPGGGQNNDPLCSLTGNSRIFVVNTTNANPFITGADSTKTRFIETPSFVTNPFTEQAQTKNPNSGSSGPTADDLGVGEEEVMEALKQLFPRECKFANYRIDIKTIAADTRIQRIAPIPICIIAKNWKEF